MHKGSEEFSLYTIEEFEKLMGIVYIQALQFKEADFLSDVQRKCLKMLAKNKLDRKQKWLGVYFSKEIISCVYPEFSIRFINEIIGYGVFAEKEILANTYIGEYTGDLRKRTFWEDKKNKYLFEYYLGELMTSKYLIDAQERGNHTRFINHSDYPNVEPIAVIAEGILRIIFFSKRKIAPGEQLCYDYGEGYWNSRIKLGIDPK